MQNKLLISFNYLERELREKERDVRGWIAAYCKRNRIPTEAIRVPVGKFYGETERYLQISFRSKNQLESFVMRGNWKFPYFEFR